MQLSVSGAASNDSLVGQGSVSTVSASLCLIYCTYYLEFLHSLLYLTPGRMSLSPPIVGYRNGIPDLSLSDPCTCHQQTFVRTSIDPKPAFHFDAADFNFEADRYERRNLQIILSYIFFDAYQDSAPYRRDANMRPIG